MTHPYTPTSTARAAAYYSAHPEFLGHQFDALMEREGLTEEDLATRLGCTVDTLHHLAVCRRIRHAGDALELEVRYGVRGLVGVLE